MSIIFKRDLYSILKLTLFVLAIAGCGGGGGGGGDESGSGKSAATGVRILHGALEGAPVDLYSSTLGATAIGNGRFGEASLYFALPTGESLLTLTARFKPSSVVYSGALNLEKNQHASILLYGDQTNFGLNGAIFSDEPGEIPDGMYAVRVIDALVGASSVLASVGGESISNGTSFGSASPYVFQAAGLKDYIVRRSFDNLVVDRGSYTFESGRVYSLFVSGEISYLVVTRVLED